MSMVRAIQVKVIWQTSDALPASISSITLMQLYIVFFFNVCEVWPGGASLFVSKYLVIVAKLYE